MDTPIMLYELTTALQTHAHNGHSLTYLKVKIRDEEFFIKDFILCNNNNDKNNDETPEQKTLLILEPM